MKNLSLFSLLFMASMVLFLGGCQREEESQLQKGDDITNSIILDSLTLHKFLLPHKDNYTSGGRSGDNMVAYDSLNKICDLILKQDSTHHFLSNFINNFGFPNWAKSFELNQYRGNSKIITIPFVKDDLVSGVLHYYSNLGENGLIFVSKEAVHSLININVSVVENFDYYAVFSYSNAQRINAQSIDIQILNWIKKFDEVNDFNHKTNANRFENCFTWCGEIIYIWEYDGYTVTALGTDCIEICTGNNGWLSNNPIPDGGFLPNTSANWWFNNPFYSGTGGTINTNNNNNNTRHWKEIKLQNAKECISKAFGIKNIQTMNKIKSASELLCGTTYEDQLIQAYDNMIEQGKDCDDLEAVNEMINDMATEVEKNIEWTKTDDFAKISEFLDENPHIDPCTGKNMKNNILKSMCDSDMSMAALNAALEGVDYIDDNAISDNKCPCVNSIWKLIKSQTANSEFGSSECSVLELLSDYLEGPLQAEIGISTLNLPESTNAVAIPNTTNVGNGNELLLFNTRIELNPLLCGESLSKDPLEIAGTLLHELIHARIFESLYNKGFDLNSVANQKYADLWKNFIQSKYPNIQPVGNDQHKFMAQAYVNDLAQALHDLNGGVGEPSDYLLIAWQGLLGAYPEETRHLYDFLPNIQTLQDNFNNNVKGKGNLQFNGCN